MVQPSWSSRGGPVVTVLHHVASGRSVEEIRGEFQYLKSGDFRWRCCLPGVWFSFAGLRRRSRRVELFAPRSRAMSVDRLVSHLCPIGTKFRCGSNSRSRPRRRSLRPRLTRAMRRAWLGYASDSTPIWCRRRLSWRMLGARRGVAHRGSSRAGRSSGAMCRASSRRRATRSRAGRRSACARCLARARRSPTSVAASAAMRWRSRRRGCA